jgi:hypothetical protein
MYRKMSCARCLSLTGAVILLFLLMPACATPGKQHAARDAEQRWGVQVQQIRLSAEGLMLDFRYRVVDKDKAAPLFSREIKPYLIDEATGAKFLVPDSPKVGSLRTTRPPQNEKIYFIIFVNPGRYVKQGNKVTVVIGDFRAENLIVE